MKSLERCYSIVDDVAAFVEAASRPQPLFAWTNTLRTTSRQLIDVLKPHGYELTPLNWHPQAYRVRCQNKGKRLGSHWSYLAGWFHINDTAGFYIALLEKIDNVSRKTFSVNKDQDLTCDGTGYVLVRQQNAVLGVKFYQQYQSVVASLFPKSRVSM